MSFRETECFLKVRSHKEERDREAKPHPEYYHRMGLFEGDLHSSKTRTPYRNGSKDDQIIVEPRSFDTGCTIFGHKRISSFSYRFGMAEMFIVRRLLRGIKTKSSIV